MQSDDNKIDLAVDTRQIKILVIDSGDGGQICITMDVPLVYNKVNKFDIIKTIFPNIEVVKDDLGFKYVNNNTEQRIQMTAVDDPEHNYHYVVDVPSLRIVRMAFQGSNNPSNLLNNEKFSDVTMIDVPSSKTKPQELNDFSNLLNSKKFSDVTLSVDGVVIPAHKTILANRSPVFDAMFTHKMNETQSSQVEIEDIDIETMFDFLYYLYAGKFKENYYTNDVFARYSNLLGAANKYCVENLKGQCEEKLVKFLTIKNVLECLTLADLHNAVTLKKQVIDFIVENADQIIELPTYKSFLLSHPDLSIEIVRALIVENNKLKSAQTTSKERQSITKETRLLRVLRPLRTS